MIGSTRTRAVALAALAALLAAGAAAAITTAAGGLPARAPVAPSADPPACGRGAQSLAVSGTGAVTTTPDVLELRLGVHTSASSAAAALDANDTAGAAVQKALAAGGVARTDVQTTGLSVQAEYASTGSAITGYAVDDTVLARIRRLATAGNVVDAAVAAGGDAIRIDSLSFSVLDRRHAQDRARDVAVHQAVAHARSMAAAAGERLGAICSLKDETTTPGPVVHFARSEPAAAAGAVPLERGTQEVRAHVEIVYDLLPRTS